MNQTSPKKRSTTTKRKITNSNKSSNRGKNELNGKEKEKVKIKSNYKKKSIFLKILSNVFKINKTPKMEKKNIIRSFIVIIVAILLTILYFNTKTSYYIDKYFTHGISNILIVIISKITNLFSFSLSEIFIIILSLYLLKLIIQMIYFLFKKKINISLYKLLNVITIFSILIISFLFIFGFNYRQLGVRYSLNIPKYEKNTEDLVKLTKKLIGSAKSNRQKLNSYGESIKVPFDNKILYDKLNQAYDKFTKNNDKINNHNTKPKPVLLSSVLSKFGITGMFFPFTAEANYNKLNPDLMLSATIVHEMSHQRGISYEEDCNFLAYKVSQESNDPYVKYSADMMALTYAMEELYKEDRNKALELRYLYSSQMEVDLNEYYSYWKNQEGTLMDNGDKINDFYLKSNGTKGTITYSEVVDLLIDDMKMQEMNNSNI